MMVFYFSTPGTGGIVKIFKHRHASSGYRRCQYGRISRLLHASHGRFFSYNWTKLSFISEDEDLLLTMELDGENPESLYHTKFNNGMLVKTTQQEGLQYPLRPGRELPGSHWPDILEVGPKHPNPSRRICNMTRWPYVVLILPVAILSFCIFSLHPA